MFKKFILNLNLKKFTRIHKINTRAGFYKLTIDEKIKELFSLCTKTRLLLELQHILKRFNYCIANTEDYINNKDDLINSSSAEEIIALFKENILYSTFLYQTVINRIKFLALDKDYSETLVQFAMYGIHDKNNVLTYCQAITTNNSNNITIATNPVFPINNLKLLFKLYDNTNAKIHDIKYHTYSLILKEFIKEIHSQIFENEIPYENLKHIEKYIPCYYGKKETFTKIALAIVNDHILSPKVCHKLLLDSGDIISIKLSNKLYGKLVFYSNN